LPYKIGKFFGKQLFLAIFAKFGTIWQPCPILPHQEQIDADKFGITLRFRDYTIDRLGVMAQKAEKMLLKIINERLCNVQIFPKV